MSGLKYTQEHEWIRVEGDVGTVGIVAFGLRLWIAPK